MTELQKKVDEIVDRYGASEAWLLAMLQDIQAEFNYLPRKALEHVAERVGVPLVRISGLATFFAAFSLKPRGKHICQVCMGTACHVRGAPRLVDELERELGVKPGETSSDGLFTVETVNCVGACAMGPLVILDGDYHGLMTPTSLQKLVRKVRAQEEKTQS